MREHKREKSLDLPRVSTLRLLHYCEGKYDEACQRKASQRKPFPVQTLWEARKN